MYMYILYKKTCLHKMNKSLLQHKEAIFLVDSSIQVEIDTQLNNVSFCVVTMRRVYFRLVTLYWCPCKLERKLWLIAQTTCQSFHVSYQTSWVARRCCWGKNAMLSQGQSPFLPVTCLQNPSHEVMTLYFNIVHERSERTAKMILFMLLVPLV